MKQEYTRSGLVSALRRVALAALLVGGATTAQAQFFTATNVVNKAGTYTDLGTTGTVISTPNFDDANSAVQTLPFTFTFGGTAFTEFVLNTNGFIKLGNVAPVAPFFSTYAQQAYTGGPLNTTSQTNLILPFNTDLEGGASTPEYRMATTGTAPNRVVTIQWKNVSDKTRAAAAAGGTIDKQLANFSFQVKLYESNSGVDFVYDAAVPSVNPTNASFVVVGLKGSSTATARVITAVKPSNNAWSSTTFQQGVYASGANAHNVRNTPIVAGGVTLPDAGRTYSFIIPTPTDAAAQLIYGYSQLAVPAGQPVTLRGLVRNAGTADLTNVSVTLSVSGANTYTSPATTVATLAVGTTAVVTFTGVPVPATGNNTVTLTVDVAGDLSTSNNSTSMVMVTNPTLLSITTPGAGSSGFVLAQADDIYRGVKYTLNAPASVTSVRTIISSAGTTAGSSKSTEGESLYAVVVNATTGAILGRSANYVVTAADINAPHTFVLTSPVALPAGDFIVGMVGLASTGADPYFPYYTQNEDPSRPNAFFAGTISSPIVPVALLDTAPDNTLKLVFDAELVATTGCPAPTSISVTGTTTTASVAFTGATGGTGYQIVYGPTGFNPASAGTTTATFTSGPGAVTGLTASTCYDFYVRTVCGTTGQSTVAGPINFCTPCVAPTISTFPYAQNFDAVNTGQSLPCGITVTDSNNDGFTWRARATVDASLATGNISRSNPNAMVYSYNNVGPTPTVGADDWFFTPGLTLSNSQRYRVSFYYRTAGQGLSERLEVKYGAAATPAGQTTTLYTNNNITATTYQLANNASTPAVADITPANGTFYVGFHATSLANQGFLAIDDLTITASPLATSEALKRAVSVFPNPSNSGQFNLEIHGANTATLAVEVTNLLGQRVYTGTAKDNLRTVVDLSNLTSGIYSLKVRNGEEFTMQQISIVK
ncbi:T9SS type A sorting domain-containing protein [Hymenobacter sp. DH14]|uniref:T9SS type A sorting domain-containing protein n=1 Tax=Hymenobacter cyanobacteriorum TaxID=2926463 RepID=A0A9X1VJK1_9BACT|nr:T9SS type A sorting domain-containing protein [Hymenobacter cyanobacteriorum]MCI1189332.1 T9SS type A sorting domain-containing protein [Hymenobacter cyanobacteriorum]